MPRIEIESNISKLRNQESNLRADLVSTLMSLANAAQRASYKIAAREWEDGLACIDRDIDNFRETQDALESAIQEIQCAEWELEDIEE